LIATTYQFWSYLGVQANHFPFSDVKVITSSMDCYRNGLDPLYNNPCDPCTPMNYPRIWLSFTPFGIGDQHTFLIGILIDILFFLSLFSLIKRINALESAVYSLVVCSPSVMLAVERGNNDIIIFALLSIVIALSRRNTRLSSIASMFLVLAASFLKFYPIMAVIIFLKERPKVFAAVAGGLLMAFLVYCLATRDDMIQIFETKIGYILTYGAAVYVDGLIDGLNMAGLSVSPFIGHLFVWIAAGAIIIRCFQHSREWPLDARLDTEHLNSFRVGAGLFTGTFLLTNNIEYRLIFLIFTLPQLLAWGKVNDKFGALSIFTMLMIVIRCWGAIWANVIPLFLVTYLLKNITEWLIFGFFIYALFTTLPPWAKQKFPFAAYARA